MKTTQHEGARDIETKMRQDIFKHVESEVYAHPYRQREIERIKEEIAHPYRPAETMIVDGKKVEVNIVKGKNSVRQVSDPTSQMAVTLASHAKLVHMERIADAIQEAYGKLPEYKQEFVRVLYWTSPQKLTKVGMCEELGISDRTFTRWRRQFVHEIAEILGWN